MTELDVKLQRINDLLAKYAVEALLLNRVSSFAWATCGAASYINTASTDGVGSLLITPTKRYLITNNIEAPRFEKEEQLAAQGWEFRVAVWHEDNPAVADLTRGLKLAADGPYPGAIDLSGSRLQTLGETDTSHTQGATWNQAGDVVFASLGQGLFRLSGSIGTPQRVTTLDQQRSEIAHSWPEFLPDGRHFLYRIRSRQPEYTGIFLSSIDADTRTAVLVGCGELALSGCTTVFDHTRSCAWLKPLPSDRSPGSRDGSTRS